MMKKWTPIPQGRAAEVPENSQIKRIQAHESHQAQSRPSDLHPSLVAEPSKIFPLLCPVREADWIEDWDPAIVLSESGVAEADCVFLTEASPSNAVWYITRHEPDNGSVEMIKIAPTVTACKLTVQLRPVGSGSEATVTYLHTSLGPESDDFVAFFTDEYDQGSMRDWEERINHYLTYGSALGTADG